MTEELTETELCEWAMKELLSGYFADTGFPFSGWLLTGDGMLAGKTAMRERGWESRSVIWTGGLCSASFSKGNYVGAGQAHTEPLAVLRAERAAVTGGK